MFSHKVLQAYSIHNSKIGYCQGMNFIAAVALLFLRKEDAFWCLIAILERFLPENYFNSGLIDAQVDQLVLKEIVNEKLPRLSSHLKRLGIDISAVTLNWFLAVFYDSVPFEVNILLLPSCSYGYAIERSIMVNLNTYPCYTTSTSIGQTSTLSIQHCP
ncbi:unnamed protein product, partial [Schistosoma mattheei]